jgi:hypothetical protein
MEEARFIEALLPIYRTTRRYCAEGFACDTVMRISRGLDLDTVMRISRGLGLDTVVRISRPWS